VWTLTNAFGVYLQYSSGRVSCRYRIQKSPELGSWETAGKLSVVFLAMAPFFSGGPSLKQPEVPSATSCQKLQITICLGSVAFLLGLTEERGRTRGLPWHVSVLDIPWCKISECDVKLAVLSLSSVRSCPSITLPSACCSSKQALSVKQKHPAQPFVSSWLAISRTYFMKAITVTLYKSSGLAPRLSTLPFVAENAIGPTSCANTLPATSIRLHCICESNRVSFTHRVRV